MITYVGALPGGASREREGVAQPAASFRKRKRSNGVRARGWQMTLLLCVCAPTQNYVIGDGILHIHDDGCSRIDSRQGFNRQYRLKKIPALTGVLFGNLDTHQPERKHLSQQILAKGARLVHGANVRTDFARKQSG